jgi:hypothetical protein
MLLLVYTAIFVPVRVAFVEDAPNGIFVFELIVDLLFMCDIVATFFSVTEDE